MIRRALREFIIFCFHVSSYLMMHRPHLRGKEHLRKVPTPVIFSPTHDSYFEIPSLSRVYYSLHPKPDFLVLAKGDFLSGRYLSSNFARRSRLLRIVFTFLDRTMLPTLIFRIMRLTTIHRPFIENYNRKKAVIKAEIGNQINRVKDNISGGLSTLIFPEGTTWGFGGLKKIRSSIYQLVENTFASAHKKVHILPINVKVDRLMKGKKDIFINVGRPVFFRYTKEEFNEQLFRLMKQLHTITFSQIGAYYLKRMAEKESGTNRKLVLAKEKFISTIEKIVGDLSEMVKSKKLPYLDAQLLDSRYLRKKAERFIKYCKKKKYLIDSCSGAGSKSFILNIEPILSNYPASEYRKQNPLGFHANELCSIDEKLIKWTFDSHLSR